MQLKLCEHICKGVLFYAEICDVSWEIMYDKDGIEMVSVQPYRVVGLLTSHKRKEAVLHDTVYVSGYDTLCYTNHYSTHLHR